MKFGSSSSGCESRALRSDSCFALMRQIASGSRFANAIRADLVAEIAALETADAAVNEADVALALARSKVRQLKL